MNMLKTFSCIKCMKNRAKKQHVSSITDLEVLVHVHAGR